MLNYLKVKVLSLAEEAKIIRREENKRRLQQMKSLAHDHPDTAEYHLKNRVGLHQHRIYDVRNEARWANLAYGLLKGNEYVQMEFRATEQPDWERVSKLALRYGEGDYKERKSRIEEWVKVAKNDWFVGSLELEKKRSERSQRRKEKKKEQSGTVLDSVQ